MLQSSQAAVAPVFGVAMHQFNGLPQMPTASKLSELFSQIAGQTDVPVKLDQAKLTEIQ